MIILITLQGIYYNFELFRIREKQIPVDKVECKGKKLIFIVLVWGGSNEDYLFIYFLNDYMCRLYGNFSYRLTV